MNDDLAKAIENIATSPLPAKSAVARKVQVCRVIGGIDRKLREIDALTADIRADMDAVFGWIQEQETNETKETP